MRDYVRKVRAIVHDHKYVLGYYNVYYKAYATTTQSSICNVENKVSMHYGYYFVQLENKDLFKYLFRLLGPR